MRAASLFLVFVVAKCAAIGFHVPAWSPWTPVAYFWQDALVALLFGTLHLFLRPFAAGRRLSASLYWIAACYAALNIPVGRALFTPLTWRMLRAARGPLVDSFLIYSTWTNAALMLLTVAVATLPLFINRLGFLKTAPKIRAARVVMSALAMAMVIGVGPLASARVDTLGFDRNVVGTLVTSGLPLVAARSATGEWRASPFEIAHPEDLSALSGIAKGRNVVLVSLESTAAQYLKLYGGERDATPHLDTLAKDAIVFENAYAAYPESIKGLFSILCSTFPSLDSTPEIYEGVPCRALPEVLTEHGYRTGLFHSGRFDYLGMNAIIQHRGYQTLEDAGDIGGNHNSSFGVDEPATVARMLAWIDARTDERPFFLTYLPIAGHHPYETPEAGPFPAHDELGRYMNALHYGDASLGALADGLKMRGLDEHTLWIIIGDHGEAFGQHEGNYGHTFYVYDENVHVPLVIAAPGAIRGQSRIRKVVSLVDLAPTICALLNDPSPAYQGRSMLDDVPSMALFFTDYSLGFLGLRDGPWKFISEIDSGRTHLFNLERDPQERIDLSSAHADRVKWYRRHLLDWSAAQKSRITN